MWPWPIWPIYARGMSPHIASPDPQEPSRQRVSAPPAVMDGGPPAPQAFQARPLLRRALCRAARDARITPAIFDAIDDADTAFATLFIGRDHGVTPQAAQCCQDLCGQIRGLVPTVQPRAPLDAPAVEALTRTQGALAPIEEPRATLRTMETIWHGRPYEALLGAVIAVRDQKAAAVPGSWLGLAWHSGARDTWVTALTEISAGKRPVSYERTD